MGGSPVRSQNKINIAQLNQSKDIQDFQAELVHLVRIDLPHTEVFFGVKDHDSKILHVPSWVRSHLERHPGLAIKLEQGAMVGISHTEESLIPRPVAAARSSIVLIPIINDDSLCGVIGLISPLDGPQLSAEEIEGVRQLGHDAAAILGRLQEIESLKVKNQEFARVVQRTTEVEATLAKVISERNHFDALLKVGWHVQSNIAHELRTPMAAIRGYARMILDGRTGDVTDTQRDYLRIINENTNRLINVANWMTHLADLSAQQFSLGSCDLLSVWADSVRKNHEVLGSKSLKLAERIPDQPFEIVADAEKLAYAFTRLIGAAVKLSDSGSTITAEFSHGREQEVMVKISVSSSGFEPETLHRISDRSIDSSLTGTVQDTDEIRASLNAVHEIIGMHGGRMFVNSTAGQGPTLLFTLPAITVGGEDKNHEQAVNISRR
jgi:signal transduction histidine kinase